MLNHLEKINEIYAFISSDENGEGVIAMQVEIKGQELYMPFVFADQMRIPFLRAAAIEIGQETKKTVKLIKLSTREDLETYECRD